MIITTVSYMSMITKLFFFGIMSGTTCFASLEVLPYLPLEADVFKTYSYEIS